jgi:hypothetical protein
LFIFSSTKLEIRAKLFLLGIEGVGGRGRGRVGCKGRGGGKGEMTQTLYAHRNKIKIKKRFAYVEPSLHHWDEPDFVRVYDLFDVL